MRSHYKRIGDYVTQIKLKNTDGSISSLKGININKHFMPSVANINGTDLSKYRVVTKNQFAFNPMHVGRDEVLPISMLEDDEPIIVSPAYVVFEVKDEEELLPAYLMMWCRRSEFDRNAWFMTDNSVRGGFSWADFCDMELPIPSIEKQREIVREYNVVNDRIALNEQLTQKLEDTAQALYKQWFVDFEFPISKEYAQFIGKPELEGKPYKSSGGEMRYCDLLEKEIPQHWNGHSLKELALIKGGKRLPKGEELVSEKTAHPYIKVADLGNKKFCVLSKKFEYLEKDVQAQISRYTVKKDDLVISIVGTIGITKIIDGSLDGANLTENCAKIVELEKISTSFLYHFLMSNEGKKQLDERIVGAVQAKLPIYNIETFKLAVPPQEVMSVFQDIAIKIDTYIHQKQNEIVRLVELKEMLLSSVSKV
ncbi:restriction endonuclease subunit S [Vibrio parahaemolyticus]|uniref:restriction endonuclease subunit S n=1 Tax=Vibrio alginolyticus TaxID=663 RepID=UPI002062DF20|nr:MULTISPECIES: restriction endonuclease subunit S [Vibrio harveyi group]EGR1972997.1 restriction endonuclease subunit S [Vibrio parahaemolyticus]EJO2022909.1 restriction endonuclease subunit S [Vibrio parahaemolyticus]ELZ7231473.1 restriction endonuclease subunit S [Vibrio parahaemolyticus]WMN91678.1 restriction endonuclease subunit S [Vibrio parahaemolyticus]WMO09332.1 restriction endonuclease subunit S [Vibrio parahaemolyticus]